MHMLLAFCPITARPGATLRAKFVTGFGANPLKGSTVARAAVARSSDYTCVEWALANSVPTGTGGSTAKALLCA